MSKDTTWILVAIGFLAAGALFAGAAGPEDIFQNGFEAGNLTAWVRTCPTGSFDAIWTPSLQCSWSAPDPGDPYPSHVQILVSPLVAELPHGAPGSPEVVVVAYNHIDGGQEAGAGINPSYFGVLRILDGDTCGLLETIHDPGYPLIGASTPAVGDLDGDGVPEIVGHVAMGGLVAFRWNGTSSSYEKYWSSSQTDLLGVLRWDGPSIHDLDDDGFPEIVSGSEVYDGRTGARLNPGQTLSGADNFHSQVLGDLNVDGAVEIVAGAVYQWDTLTNVWLLLAAGSSAEGEYAYADLGSPVGARGTWDSLTKDGLAEVVAVGSSSVNVVDLDGGQVLPPTSVSPGTGGPPALADVDGDGLTEIVVASGQAISVFDPSCDLGCTSDPLRWQQPIQDLSSARSKSAAFDFDADGAEEVVFGDECFARVFDGSTGDVLLSHPRTSCTFYEGLTVADTNGDDAAELVIGSNANCSISCPLLDPIHPGVRCQSGSDCLSGLCDQGLCRCSSSADCPSGTECATALPAARGVGDTCRAAHTGLALTGIQILKGGPGPWAPSSTVWNQHAYSVTHISRSGKSLATSNWVPNFLDSRRNDFRTQEQLCAP